MASNSNRTVMLAVLAAILTFNFVDRLALGLVLQDIKKDLVLSDTELGVLTGLAFALFYSVMGVPIARWADRGNRVAIISVTSALWSVAVSLCGWVGSFTQLLLLRIGTAVGEAGCMPPAQSLIADYFTRDERPRAMAQYMLGAPLASVIGYFLGGWLNESYGWRKTFFLLGLPGLILAVLAQLVLREPRLGKSASGVGPPESEMTPAPSLKEVGLTLWSNITFRHLLICYSLCSFFGIGVFTWLPAFFVRSFGLHTSELGAWLALLGGLGGLLGTYWGGRLAARYAANNERLQLKVMCFLYLAFGIVSSGIYLTHDLPFSLGLLGLALLGVAMVNGPLFAVIQTLVPPPMRATAIAIVFLAANLVGMGLGPLAVGALSDALHAVTSEESLRYALLAMCPGYAWVAWYFWRASKTVARDSAATESYLSREKSPMNEVRLLP